MEFVAVDVETANADFSSICQVGIASFKNGELVETWSSLVNPEDWFSPVNIGIHGITEQAVAEAPTWNQILPAISSRLQNEIAVCHTHFDRIAFAKACARYGQRLCECTWLDSAKVVRRAWPQFAHSGYGLSNLAKHFGIEYGAHDALEDARCAGIILSRAIAETGIDVRQWLKRVDDPIKHLGISPCSKESVSSEFSGEIVVFTGALSIPRSSAAVLAESVGCRVDDNVTRHTSLLVVGDQDLRRLSGHDKSTKHRKAETLIEEGRSIRIIGESDFMTLISHSPLASITSL